MNMEELSQYRIVIEGELNESWAKWLGEVPVEILIQKQNINQTTLFGFIPDQAALRGLLNRIWDLNLKLISVTTNEQELDGGSHE
jgi:hypothetical protein